MIPLVIMISCFIYVGYKIRKTSRTVVNTLRESKIFGPMHSHERAVTKTAILVIGTYILLVMPTSLVFVIHPMPPNEDYPG